MSADMVKVFAQAPCEALRPYVKRLLAIEYAVARDDSHLPATGFFAAFPYRGECRLPNGQSVPQAALTGLTDQLRRHAHGRGNAVIVAAFTPTGAAALLRQPLDELANETFALNDLLGDAPGFDRLHEQLNRAPNASRRLRLVEDVLLARLHGADPDPLVNAAVAWLERAPAEARIEHLVRHIGLSQSALERRFRRVVGASPRRFASIVRLGRVEQLAATGAAFTAIAQAAGYFDQSHLNHDFKRATGLTPESYFRRTPSG